MCLTSGQAQFRYQLVFFVHIYGYIWLAEGCLWHLLPRQNLLSASFAWAKHAAAASFDWRHDFTNTTCVCRQTDIFKRCTINNVEILSQSKGGGDTGERDDAYISSKEDKEAMLNRKMEEIRRKNEALKKRHEVCYIVDRKIKYQVELSVADFALICNLSVTGILWDDERLHKIKGQCASIGVIKLYTTKS